MKVTPSGMVVVKGIQKVEIVEIRSVHHHVFDEVFMEEEPDHSTNLFEKLRGLRKMIADSVGMAPYIIFTDKTLHEMADRLPLTREEMLAIQGVSQNKFEKYGDDFLNLIARENTGIPLPPKVKVEEVVSADELKKFAAMMDEQMISVSPHTLTKILLASDKGTFPAKVTLLPFFGLLKNRIKHKELLQLIKNIYDQQSIAIYKHAADTFFTESTYNNIPEITRNQLKQTIASLPENRPTSTITNEYILNQRKTHPRSYEHWLEPEITIFREVVSQTNDINFITTIFNRSHESVKAYYK
ncbi:MAG TPA: HRDC domain-containing protein [Bacteroidia bacterium]|nr:HRDC domain-containing protein [Bacteroidia bacterium]